MWYNIFAPLNAELIWRSIEVVATRTTRNRFVGDEPARGFESLLLRQRVPRTQFRGEVLFLRFSPALHADSCRKHKRVPRPQFRGEVLFFYAKVFTRVTCRFVPKAQASASPAIPRRGAFLYRFSPAENALRLLHSQQRRYNKSSKVIFKLLHTEWAHDTVRPSFV